MTPEPLIAELNVIRRDRRMSVAEWARRAGINEHTVRDLVKGEAGPKLTTVAALAGVFDMDVAVVPRDTTPTHRRLA